MIELTQGNILTADAEALVNTVNCVGVMGRGVALQFRKAYPANFKVYKAACSRKELQPGTMLTFALDTLTNPRYIINFPTKMHWKGSSRLEYIEQGLTALTAEVIRLSIRSIALPPLGCGLGGLNWPDVKTRIETAFTALPDVRVLLYEPSGAPAPNEMAKEAPPRMTLSRAVLLKLMEQYLAALMDPTVSLLEVHKLMYFMQEAGEGLKLRYEKAPYGPYSKNLRHALTAIEGHFLNGYGDAADDPRKQNELNWNAIGSAAQTIQEAADTNARLARVAELIRGFETPFGMELLSTVHWVAVQEQAVNVEDAITKIYAWNSRKKMFRKEHIGLAWEVLAQQGWITEDVEAR